MKHSIIIRSATGTSGGWLRLGNINHPKGNYTIVRGMDGGIRCVLTSELLPSDEVFLTNINPQKAFNFSFDDDVNNKDNRNAERKLAAEVIPYHPQMHDVEGFIYYNAEGMQQSTNPNSGAGLLFEMEDVAANHARNVKVINQIISAMNKVRAMSYREKLDVMYFYNESPVTPNGVMSHSEVFVRLTEPAFGLVLKRNMFANTGMTFMEHFLLEYQSGDKDLALKTTILKGLVICDKMGEPIIKKSGTAMMFAGVIIGNTIEEAVAFLTNDEKLKNALLTTVSQMDVLNQDDLDEIVDKISKGRTDVHVKMDFKNNYNELKERAKKMRIPIPGVPTLESLKEKIAEAEPVWEKVKEYGLEARINANSIVRLPKIIEWVKEKEKELKKELV